jgi:hypothetical protein
MRAHRLLTPLAVVLALAAASLPARAADTTRHSGTVRAVDPAAGRMVIEEVGPWVVEKGLTRVAARTIRFTPETKFSVFMRVDRQGYFAGDFMEVPLEPGDVSPGDFVTAECVRRGRDLVAVTVTIAEVGE